MLDMVINSGAMRINDDGSVEASKNIADQIEHDLEENDDGIKPDTRMNIIG